MGNIQIQRNSHLWRGPDPMRLKLLPNHRCRSARLFFCAKILRNGERERGRGRS